MSAGPARDTNARSFPPALAIEVEEEQPARAARVAQAAERLAVEGAAALATLDDDRLERAFLSAVAAFRDPGSSERRGLDPALRESAALSAGCLDASLDALLDGFTTAEVRTVFARARRRRERPRVIAIARDAAPRSTAPHLVVLAGNLPGVALQPLLVSLALHRPAILKSSSREPFFAPAFAAALAQREPALDAAIAAIAWRGGDAAIEEPLLAGVDRVVAYGGALALADLRRRAADKLIAFGPKASVALVAHDLDAAALEHVAAALARDIALFDQRGCLSLQAIYTDGDADALAQALARALHDAALQWPPFPLTTAEAAAIRLVREEASFLGSSVAATPIETGTVLLDRRSLFLPTPGHRTVRIHPVGDLDTAIAILRPHGPRLQGAALAGDAAIARSDDLRAFGLSYLCEPGRLQSPGASWPNGGIDLIEALA
jgi:hypothetical protein